MRASHRDSLTRDSELEIRDSRAEIGRITNRDVTNYESNRFRLLRRIQRSPEIPGGHRTVRTPFFTELHELFWSGEFSSTESFRETFAHSVIVNGPDIRPAQIEKKKHLDRPSADSTHRSQTRNDLIIGHAEKRAARWHGAVDGFRGQIF